jgi:DNA-directed RNA polymerase subunit K/omega
MDPVTQEKLLAKATTKYRLVSLMQKRAVELMRGMPPLVEGTAGEIWPTITQEILTDKIQLVTGADAEKLRREIAIREAEEVPAIEKKDAAPAAKTEAGAKAEPAVKDEKKEG